MNPGCSTRHELLRKADLYERAGSLGDAHLIGFARALRSLARGMAPCPGCRACASR